ncbi:MAG: effector-associated domain EAD1-containing protein [Cyanobacteria bacterium P01_A01_bin.37]
MPKQIPLRRVLFLAANPQDTAYLKLDSEAREIQEGLRLSAHRNRFELVSKWAVQTDDLRRALLEHDPHIIHFSGHGKGEQGITLDDGQGKSKLVSGDTLARLFKQFQNIECVLLNTCYSDVQAQAIAPYVPYVIGMGQAIGDEAAIEFATGFYDGLGYGRTYPEAFELGLSAIDLEGIPETQKPRLKARHNGKNLQLTNQGLAIQENFATNSAPIYKMPESLSLEAENDLIDAIQKAFPTEQLLGQMLRRQLAVRLNEVVQNTQTYSMTVEAVVGWAANQGRLGNLWKGCITSNPGSPQLKAFSQKWMVEE